ncbi:MAG: peptide ABC transporter ATP-binding protein, partial [Chloroflexi bacterium]|nr:peptide ABC transporter ATP-binding protein [Chloroflexota bacterium]
RGRCWSHKLWTYLSQGVLVPRPGARIVDGKIWFRDQDLLELSEQEMRGCRGHKIAMIMQDPQTSLNPVFTIGDQVSEPVRVHLHQKGQQALERVLEALRAVRIPRPELRLK